MSEDKSLYQSDRRKSLREEYTDRRNQPRTTFQMTKFKVMVIVAVVIVLSFIVYVINPSI